MFLTSCALHIAISVGKVTISPHNRNILLSSGIHWHSNRFNGDSDFFLRREKNYNYLHTLRKNKITVQYLVGKYLNESTYARMFSQFSSYLSSLTFFKLIEKIQILPSNVPVIMWLFIVNEINYITEYIECCIKCQTIEIAARNSSQILASG